MDEANRLCDVCGGIQVTLCCLCGGRESFLCDSCLSQHFAKNPGRFHQTISVPLYGQSAILGNFCKLQARTSELALRRVEVLRNLERVDACIADFNVKIDSIITILREFAQATVTKLQEIKLKLQGDIKTALDEVEETLYCDKPKLQTKLARYLRYLIESDVTENPEPMMQLFIYQIDQSPYPTILTSILKIMLNQAETFVLPRVKGNTFQVYSLQGKLQKSGILPVTFSEEVMYCLINDDSVMCIGGNSANAYSLSISRGDLTHMKSMQTLRGSFGILKVETIVYTLGGKNSSGYGGSMKSCEKYNLETNEWAALPDMLNSRYAFTPCHYSGAIYIASNSQIEMLELASEKFKEVKVSLTLENAKFALFVADGELLALSENGKLARWNIHSTEKTFRVSEVAVTSEWVETNSTHVQVGRDRYWVSQKTEGVIAFNVDSLKLRKA